MITLDNNLSQSMLASILMASASVSAFAEEALYIDESGSIGIGTEAPTEQLHIIGGATGELKMRLEQSDTNAWAYSVVAADGFGKTDVFRISKQGSGGPELEVSRKNDAGGVPTLEVFGSIKATNVVFSSSRDSKTDFKALDTSEILHRVATLPITQWRFKDDESARVHIGPMAEDFTQTFQLDGPDNSISVADSNGIALAAIQGLMHELAQRDQRIDQLEQQIQALASQIKDTDRQDNR
jgi:hypothetical protein